MPQSEPHVQELLRQQCRARAVLGPDSVLWPVRLAALFERHPSEADTLTSLLSDTVDLEQASIIIQALSTLPSIPPLSLARLLAYASSPLPHPLSSHIEALTLAIRFEPTSPLAALVLSRLCPHTIDPSSARLIVSTLSTLAISDSVLCSLVRLSAASPDVAMELWPCIEATTSPRILAMPELWLTPLRSKLLLRASSYPSLAMHAMSLMTAAELLTIADAYRNSSGPGIHVLQGIISMAATGPARRHLPLIACLLSLPHPTLRAMAMTLLSPTAP